MIDSNRTFSPQVQAVIEEFIPICKALAGDQPYAISVSGSLGKGTWDHRSDIDFRLFTQHEIQWPKQRPDLWADYDAATARWQEKGVRIDGIWPRTISDVDAALQGWMDGKIQPLNLLWTIWGYHILPDIYHQHIIEDRYGIITRWKERLSTYPPRLKQAILEKYGASLRYWRSDYHYAHKVERGDVVFLAGMTSKLVHEILQILFALNETYFVGDGSNLAFVQSFQILPAEFAARVQTILYPPSPDPLACQYSTLMSLIDEVLLLTQA